MAAVSSYYCYFFFNVFKLFILPVLGLCCCTWRSLVAASQGYSVVGVHRLLIVVVSVIAEHRLSSWGTWT